MAADGGIAKVLVISLDSGLPICSCALGGRVDLHADDDLRVSSLLFTLHQLKVELAAADGEAGHDIVDILEQVRHICSLSPSSDAAQGGQRIFSLLMGDLDRKRLIVIITSRIPTHMGERFALKARQEVMNLPSTGMTSRTLKAALLVAQAQLHQQLHLMTKVIMPLWGDLLLLSARHQPPLPPLTVLTPLPASAAAADLSPVKNISRQPSPSKQAPRLPQYDEPELFCCLWSKPSAASPSAPQEQLDTPDTASTSNAQLQPAALPSSTIIPVPLPVRSELPAAVSVVLALDGRLTSDQCADMLADMFAICPMEVSPIQRYTVQSFAYKYDGSLVAISAVPLPAAQSVQQDHALQMVSVEDEDAACKAPSENVTNATANAEVRYISQPRVGPHGHRYLHAVRKGGCIAAFGSQDSHAIVTAEVSQHLNGLLTWTQVCINSGAIGPSSFAQMKQVF